MANKQIIVLDRVNIPSDFSFRYAMWAAVPAARQSFYANAAATSAWNGAAAGEITALQNGSVVERVAVAEFPAGTGVPAIKAALQAAFTAFQNRITNDNSWNLYGTFYDGTSWTTGGVA